MTSDNDVELLERPIVKSEEYDSSELKFALKPEHLKNEDEDSSEDDEDYNERYRSDNEEQVYDAESVTQPDSYVRDIERSFNPLTDKEQVEEYIKDDLEFAISPYTDENDIRRNKNKKNSMLSSLFKVSSLASMKPLRGAMQNILLAKVVAENVSTYRFHSIRDPKNQAGIFDNKKVKDRQIEIEERKSDAHHAEDVLKSREHHGKTHGRY